MIVCKRPLIEIALKIFIIVYTITFGIISGDCMGFVCLPDDQFAEEAVSVIEKARRQDVVLRVLGALGVYLHSIHDQGAVSIYKKIKRFDDGKYVFTDLDVMAYGKQRKQIIQFFERTLYFKPNLMINALFGGDRLIYNHPLGNYKVDVFFDKLMFSHDVRFGREPGKGRLELDYPTITLADLVLEKTQIHQINLKDIVDLIVVFAGHEVEVSNGAEVIDGKYVAETLADDWGFWYDAVHNLDAVKFFAKKFNSEGKLTNNEHILIVNRVNKLLKIIEETPKTKNWLKRAKVGTSKPWYNKVEDLT